MADQVNPADAGSMAEFKKNSLVNSILGGSPTQAERPSQAQPETPTETKEADSTTSEADKAGSSETTDDSGRKPQGNKRQDRTAEGRIAQLAADNKREKDRADKAERDLQELRNGTRKPEETKPAESKPAETAKPVAAGEDGKPKLIDFYNDKKYITLEEAQEAYNDARDDWRDRQQEKKRTEAEASKTQTERVTAYQARFKEDMWKRADFQEVVAPYTGPLNPGIKRVIEASKHPGELVYQLAKNASEYERIGALSPEEAFYEAVRFELGLSTEDPPEDSKPIVSKAPAPAERVNGVGHNGSKDPAKAPNFSAFKADPRIQKLMNQ